MIVAHKQSFDACHAQVWNTQHTKIITRAHFWPNVALGLAVGHSSPRSPNLPQGCAALPGRKATRPLGTYYDGASGVQNR